MLEKENFNSIRDFSDIDSVDMPPTAQLPNQQLPPRETGLFKKVVVC